MWLGHAFLPSSGGVRSVDKSSIWSGTGIILEEIASYEARDKQAKPWLINDMNLYSMWIALAKIQNLLEKTK